ncbi:cobaltochelatase subunit CobN [Rhodoplanes sp. TEM]|uniref:Cobaltochelatase subunit CobN n=1 Tax=Rhodoplanes tepidamans TaxID=200616 RepID=A0ABT5J6N7_RHOTP|nr:MULTISPECIES: cobaltochelatase subunit CobN [Rhodoplanes]MDC7784700.1 cobaltochelatase subunit CobN [Rhodoplanes tepidamans]MDC7982167.1 cobaltochelatase subunit CobN [Rhodoplanes sp. TEM]MDQ0356171.1 cobaltochelatase CobN [Rhodoplanes tepidamans]
MRLGRLLLALAVAVTAGLQFARPAAAQDRAVLSAAPLSIVVLAPFPSNPGKGRLMEALARERGLTLDYVMVDKLDDAAVAEALRGRDLVLLDWVMETTFVPMVARLKAPLAAFPGKVWGGLMWRRPDLTRGLSAEAAARIHAYWTNGGEANVRALLDYVRVDLFGRPGPAAAAPVLLPEIAIYHPDAPQRVFETLADFLAWRAPRPEQPIIGVGLHRSELVNNTTDHVDDVIRRIEKAGAVALPFWDPNNGRRTLPLLQQDGRTVPDALVSFTGVYTNVDEQREWMTALDRPVIQVLPYTEGYEEDWRKDDAYPVRLQGVFYSLAEAAGRIDPTLVTARRHSDEKLAAIPAQADALVARALGQAALHRKPNAEKTVAIFVWNSPAGEENFSASYLNVPASIVEIVAALRREGYDAPAVDEATVIATMKRLIRPYYRTKDDRELRALLADGLAERLPLAEYEAFLAGLPAERRAATEAAWGKPDDTYLTLRDGDRIDFVVPRWKIGKLVILPQPLRGARRDQEDDITHDKKRPLHHAYRAVYLGVTRQMAADAVVHLGTHGTQEWAPGKERAPAVSDDTQTTIGNVPVIYPYTTANVGEAIIARRRGRAVTVSHNTPPFAPSGLYGEFAAFHELLHQAAGGAEGAVRDAQRRQVIEQADVLGITRDIGVTAEDAARDVDGFLDKVHRHLHTVGAMPQPLGLHTFGRVADAEKTLSTVLQILGPDYLKAWGKDPAEVLAEPYEKLQSEEAFMALRRAVVEGADLAEFSEAVRPFLDEARRHWANITQPMEMASFVKALSGRFVPPSTGNDPLRNPEAVPTGRNIYGFDARKIPTKAAWEAGGKLADALVEDYRTKHGTWPDKIAFSLWQTETLNHFGVMEAQVMRLLGVRPVWNQRGDVTGVEVVPREALGRPRIDTVLSITGLYRDNLPELAALLQGAVDKVSALDEPDNPLVAAGRRIADMLVGKGIAPERAARLARVRLFGNESGVYGTNLPEATLASGSWDDEATLAKTYLSRMGYAFGTDPDTRNVRIDELGLFAEALKGTKAAVLSRSSNAHGVVSIDHPFEYLGGLALAVRQLDGRSPDLVISDLRNPRDAKNQSVAQFMSTELRSRNFHPRYVAALMNEGYAGANRMLEGVNNFWGWSVMDPGSVRADQWQEFHDVYVADKHALGLKDWFMKDHPAALAQISERMLEAVRKGYWDAPEEVVKRLVETHREIAESRDLLVENQKFADFVAAKAAGFGLLAAPPPETASDAAPETAAETPATVTGMRLERQPEPEAPEGPKPWVLYLTMLGALGAGAGWELLRALAFTGGGLAGRRVA